MRWLLVVLTCCSLACGGSSEEHDPINDTCPVQPGKPVDSSYEIVYEGRTIRFCCEQCLDDFKADPKKYLANLEVDKPPDEPRHTGPTKLETIERLRDELTPSLIAIVGLMALGLVAGRVRERTVARPPVSKAGRVVERIAHFLSPAAILGGIAIALVLGLGALAWRTAGGVSVAGENPIQRNMMLDAIDRVVKDPYPGKIVVYRGNDERDERLFNGGRYRTTTFAVSLRAAGSTKDLQAGDPADRFGLTLRLEIERAPNTAPQFYKAEFMKRVTLVGPPTGIKDIPPRLAGLTVLVPDWKWEAVLKIDDAATPGIATLCTEPPKDGACPVHYGIHYAILIKDGKLAPSTRVYMGATYVPTGVLREEWLSYDPIPTIPDGKNVTDPKLLGFGSGYSTPPPPPQKVE